MTRRHSGDRPRNYEAKDCGQACRTRNDNFLDKSDISFLGEEIVKKKCNRNAEKQAVPHDVVLK